MATQVQLRRGTSTQNDSFTGAQGELTFDTTNKRVRIHDGATTGGFELKTENAGGDTLFADNEKAIFGAGSDLQIYHDGSHSRISDQGTGNLIINAGEFRVNTANDGEAIIKGNTSGDVELYYSGALKLSTTASGISVSGTVTSDGLSLGDFTDALTIGDSNDLSLYHASGNATIKNDTGDLTVRSDSFRVKNNANNEEMFSAYADGAVTLFHNNATKLATTSTGINVTGTAVTDGLTVAGNVSVDGGTIKLDGNYPVGTSNVALGDTALDDGSLSGGYNTAVGAGSLSANTSGQQNASLGAFSLDANTTGSYNAGFGQSSLGSNTTGSNNTGLGRGALSANTTASNNTAVGYQSLYANTGVDNSALGYESLWANTTGVDNSGFGRSALALNTTGRDNNAFGYTALYANTTGNYNVALGKEALRFNTTANYNNAVGYQALYSNTTTQHNNAFGWQSLKFNNGGISNSGFGDRTLGSNTTGDNNTAMGYMSLYANTTGIDNTAVGYQAGYSNTVNSYNTYLGDHAGYATTSTRNTFLGHGSGESITTGERNTILGRFSGNVGGLDIRTSSNNIVLSDGDGNPRFVTNSSGYSSIGSVHLNNSVGLEVRTGSTSALRVSGGHNTACKVEIGYDNTNGAYIKAGSSGNQKLQVYVDNNSLAAEFRGNGDFYSNDGTVHSLSDSRVKKDIADLTDGLDLVKQLRPRTFKFNGKATTLDDDRTRYGFVADEVMAVASQYVSLETQTIDDVEVDDFKSLSTTKMIPMLVKAIQELSAKNDALEARIATLEG